MRYGVHLPIFGPFGGPAALVELAVLAEESGWDGVFVWDHIWFPGSPPTADPIVALGAIAQATERVLIGPLVMPLARRRPAKVARETVTLDRLSEGRFLLGVGLGVPRDYELFGDDPDAKARGDATDASLDFLRKAWAGEPVADEGGEPVVFTPGPHDPERGIPLWGAARASAPPRPFRRAASLDGIAPVPDAYDPRQGLEPDEVAAVAEQVKAHRGTLEGYDVVAIGSTARGSNPADFERAGATWWVEDVHPDIGGLDWARKRIAAGPTS
jgi:alkanesulfonate monooxygenase SsuD/methylene tetrahydromethanopterin reductase-like flavin-dependent oxidoreductase (luciferase family)